MLGDTWATLVGAADNPFTGRPLSYYDRAATGLDLGLMVMVPSLLKGSGLSASEMASITEAIDASDPMGGVLEAGVSKAAKKLTGSGPVPGVIEVSDLRSSTEAFKKYNPAEPVEFVFDTRTNRFVVGKPRPYMRLKLPGVAGHDMLSKTINASPNDVVGGMFRRGSDGTIILDEHSGHFWKNWDKIPDVRETLIDFLTERTGQKVINKGF